MSQLFSALADIAAALRQRSRPAGQRAKSLRGLAVGAGLLLAGGAAGAFAMQAGGASDAGAADRSAIEAIVRDYILANPEIIPEALEALKSKRAAAVVEDSRTAFETPYRGAWEGSENPKVTIVEFFDYACGYCRAALPDIARIVKDNPDVRVVYRELPILSDASTRAARVSLLAAEEQRYMAFHNALYAAGEVSDQTILAAADKAGLDRAKAKAALTSEVRDLEIAGNIRLAQSIQAEGTPLFIIGDRVLFGNAGYDALKDAVTAARK